MTTPHPIHPQRSIDHDPRTGSYTTTFDWSGDVPLSTAVITVVSRVAGVDHTDLDPLNDAVDPDALDCLFDRRDDGSRRAGGTVSFAFAGHEVTVRENGEIVVRRT